MCIYAHNTDSSNASIHVCVYVYHTQNDYNINNTDYCNVRFHVCAHKYDYIYNDTDDAWGTHTKKSLSRQQMRIYAVSLH